MLLYKATPTPLHRPETPVCYTTYDAFATVCSSAVVPHWIRFISAFPARRLIQRQI